MATARPWKGTPFPQRQQQRSSTVVTWSLVWGMPLLAFVLVVSPTSVVGFVTPRIGAPSSSLAFLLTPKTANMQEKPPSCYAMGTKKENRPVFGTTYASRRSASTWPRMMLSNDDSYNDEEFSSDESSIDDDDSEEEEGVVMYNDFDDLVVGADTAGLSNEKNRQASIDTSVLRGRLDQLVEEEQGQQAQILQNWNDGHWTVRGCSLDPEQQSSATTQGDQPVISEETRRLKTLISCLATLEDDHDNGASSANTILVGRTDGSICWLQLGSDEYLATFTNQLTATARTDSANNNATTLQVQQTLKRQDNQATPSQMAGGGAAPSSSHPTDSIASRFEILGQLQLSSTGPINQMAIITSERDDDFSLFAVVGTSELHFLPNLSEEGPPPSTNTASTRLDDDSLLLNPLVGLQALEHPPSGEFSDSSFVYSCRSNGLAQIWQVTTGAGPASLFNEFLVLMEGDNDAILSCAVDTGHVYFGTQSGRVLVYSIESVMTKHDPKTEQTGDLATALDPLKSFAASSKGGISALCPAGDGVMGRPGQPTIALATGTTHGEIKQWELLPMGKDRLEYWPKLESQTIKGKAHVLASSSSSSSSSRSTMLREDEDQDIEKVLSLQVIPGGQALLSASTERMTIWDPVQGTARFDMDGLEFTDGCTCSCLLLSDHLLVTNGMQQYVCVHDFSTDPTLDVDDMLEELE